MAQQQGVDAEVHGVGSSRGQGHRRRRGFPTRSERCGNKKMMESIKI